MQESNASRGLEPRQQRNPVTAFRRGHVIEPLCQFNCESFNCLSLYFNERLCQQCLQLNISTLASCHFIPKCLVCTSSCYFRQVVSKHKLQFPRQRRLIQHETNVDLL